MNPCTILWVSSRGGDGQYQRGAVFNSAHMTIIQANMRAESFRNIAQTDIDIVAVETSETMQDDIELCLRLRQRFDTPLILITSNITEDFAIAAYRAGVDECILGPISANLLGEKINAHLRRLERIPRKAKYSTPGANGAVHANGFMM